MLIELDHFNAAFENNSKTFQNKSKKTYSFKNDLAKRLLDVLLNFIFPPSVRPRDLIWFDALFYLIWICEIIIDACFDSNHGCRRSQWRRWKMLAESFRSVPYLSMKPWFWPYYGLILVTPKILIWNPNQIMIWFDLIWFDAIFLPKIMIWFDLTPCKKVRDLIWFDLRWSHFCVDLIWFDLNLPTPDWKHESRFGNKRRDKQAGWQQNIWIKYALETRILERPWNNSVMKIRLGNKNDDDK